MNRFLDRCLEREKTTVCKVLLVWEGCGKVYTTAPYTLSAQTTVALLLGFIGPIPH